MNFLTVHETKLKVSTSASKCYRLKQKWYSQQYKKINIMFHLDYIIVLETCFHLLFQLILIFSIQYSIIYITYIQISFCHFPSLLKMLDCSLILF